MCEIFAINSNKDVKANELLRKFYSHSDEHKDGWGLAVFNDHGVSMEKEAVQASKSKYLSQRLSGDVVSNVILAHIRRASIGSIEYANCHPFIRNDVSGRTWTLIHNGTFFSPALITPYLNKQEGTTDSEAILLYIIDLINDKTNEKGEELNREERFKVIDGAVCALADDNRINLLIYDGDVLYAHANYKGTLYEFYENGTRLIATTPLTFDKWQPVPLNQLISYKDGEKVAEGTMHGHDFLDEGHDMSAVYMSYAEL